MANENLPAMDMDEFVKTAQGINLILRGKMMKAFDSDNAKGELREMIWDSREVLIQPEVRETLKEYWNQNF